MLLLLLSVIEKGRSVSTKERTRGEVLLMFHLFTIFIIIVFLLPLTPQVYTRIYIYIKRGC